MKNISRYVFLNTDRTDKEEYEVTDYSIGILSEKYDYLTSYEKKSYSKLRNQMSSSGAWLQPYPDCGKRVDVVADIMTSQKFICDNNSISKRVKTLYSEVYHSIGNIIPIPEGANYGGRSGTDNYFIKLDYIRKQLTKIEKNEEILDTQEEELVNARLDNGLYLSPAAKGKGFPCFQNKLILRYWLKNESGFKCWKDYVEANFLKGNFVNDDFDLSIKKFDYNAIKDEDISELAKNIIKRSLQILGEDCSEGNVETVLHFFT